MTTGDGDDPAVQRRRRVVGVALELGGVPERLGPCLAGGLTPLGVDREQPGDPGRRGVTHAATAGELGSHAQAALPARTAEGAHRRVILRRGFVADVGDLEVGAERDGHRVEQGTDVRRRGRHAHDPTFLHTCQPRAFWSRGARSRALIAETGGIATRRRVPPSTFATCSGSVRGSGATR